MDESILATISGMLGIQVDENHFDTDILVHINSALNRLFELGVGPSDKPFVISGTNETWSDFWSDADSLLQLKTFMYLYVKLLFDPPASGFATTAMQEEIAKLEWLMYVMCDNDRTDIYNPYKVYSVGDKCINKDKYYVRIVAQTVPEPRFKPENWKEFVNKDPHVEEFSTLKNYYVGNKCTREDKYYVAIADIPAGEWDAEKWVEYTP